MLKNARLALLVGTILTLPFSSVSIAQTTPTAEQTTPSQTKQTSFRHVTGVIESLGGVPLRVRLSDGSVKTYATERQIFKSLNLYKDTAILISRDIDVPVSKGGGPFQAFNGYIINVNNNQLTVMLTNGQMRTVAVQPEFVAQLQKLQRSPEVPTQMPITGIVDDTSPLYPVDNSPSTVTTAPTPQMAKRISQARHAKATYQDLMAACGGRQAEVNKLKTLQDVSNNVVEFNRISVVDINEVLKGHNAEAFQHQHANHSETDKAVLRDALDDVSVIIPNTNQQMPLKEALLMQKVKLQSVTGVKIPDVYYGTIFVFYDSTAQ